MRKFLYFFSGLLLLACNKKEKFDGPNFYSDNFESYEVIDSIIDGDNQRWSFFQKTREDNLISIDTTFGHLSSTSIKSVAKAGSDGNASKASINKQFMAFWEGDVVRVDFWVYLVGNESAEWLFLFDIEEKTPIGAGAGMRLALVNEQLAVEHKYPNPDIYQNQSSAINFPRDQWVNITFEALLSTKKKGYVKVWQDGVLLIDQTNWKTLPKDILYANQGSRRGYSQIEFGITANTQESDLVMFVDDINVFLVE